MKEQIACNIPDGPERPDDPVGTPRLSAILERFDGTLVDVMKAPDRATASTVVGEFTCFARMHAVGVWELAVVRRLELSGEVSILLRFDDDIRQAVRIATELVSLPCHRRMAQLWELLVLAGYCRERGHPEAVWPHLLKAVSVVETEIPNSDQWLIERARIRGILAELWNAMNSEDRESLAPYEPSE